MLLPLASRVQFAARLPSGVAAADEARADAVLEDASALVRAEAGKTWVTGDALDTDLPDVIVSIVIACAKRAFVNPEDLESVGVDGHTARFRDVYLTKNERRLVRQAAGRTGLWTQSTTRLDDAGTPDVPYVYLDVEYVDGADPAEPIPWDSTVS